MTVRTRFAPSPTGYLHIGGVRTALFNWLFAKKHGGQFLLRIDDTDQKRNVEEALQPILHGFRWLGLTWDEGPDVGGPFAPYFQSQRTERYSEAVAQLLQSGHAYRDFATTEEVASEREAAEKAKQPWVYSRRYAAEDDAAAARFESEGRSAVVRLKMPREGVCRFTDLVRGPMEIPWQAEQDIVIQRTDGTSVYHLATVVDDHDFQITHVIRAEEHLPNTARQIFLAKALGYDVPEFAHLPVVAEPGSKVKLSKRKIAKYLKDGDFKKLQDLGEGIAQRIGLETSPETFNPVLTEFYEIVGFLPEAILNDLLLLGWSLDDKTDEFTVEQMIESFSLDRVQKSPASFAPAKLLAFQERAMRSVPIKHKVALVLPYLQKAGLVSTPPDCEIGPYLTRVVAAIGDRLRVAGDILDYDEMFVEHDGFAYDEAAFAKRIISPVDAADLLAAFRDRLETLDPFDEATVEEAMKRLVADHNTKIGNIIHAVRVAVTGKANGFGMFETLAILGRNACVTRIDRALAHAAFRHASDRGHQG